MIEFALPEEEVESDEPTGSIFNQGQVNSIYSDIKAHRVGDLITVQLVESTSANKNANSQQSKDSSPGDGRVEGGGTPVTINGYDTSVDLGANNSFKGPIQGRPEVTACRRSLWIVWELTFLLTRPN